MVDCGWGVVVVFTALQVEGLWLVVAWRTDGAGATVRQASPLAGCLGSLPWLSVSIAQPVTQEVAKLRDGNRDELIPAAKAEEVCVCGGGGISVVQRGRIGGTVSCSKGPNVY